MHIQFMDLPLGLSVKLDLDSETSIYRCVKYDFNLNLFAFQCILSRPLMYYILYWEMIYKTNTIL